MMPAVSLATLVLVGVASPALLFVLLGGASLANRPLPERWIGSLAAATMVVACGALLAALTIHGVIGTSAQLLSYGTWSTAHEGGIALEFLVDRLSLAFAAL